MEKSQEVVVGMSKGNRQTDVHDYYRIVKVGRGSSKPKKYRKCANCGSAIYDFRIEQLNGDSPRTYFCVHCLFKAFLDEQKKSQRWYRKLINLFFNRN